MAVPLVIGAGCIAGSTRSSSLSSQVVRETCGIDTRLRGSSARWRTFCNVTIEHGEWPSIKLGLSFNWQKARSFLVFRRQSRSNVLKLTTCFWLELCFCSISRLENVAIAAAHQVAIFNFHYRNILERVGLLQSSDFSVLSLLGTFFQIFFFFLAFLRGTIGALFGDARRDFSEGKMEFYGIWSNAASWIQHWRTRFPPIAATQRHPVKATTPARQKRGISPTKRLNILVRLALPSSLYTRNREKEIPFSGLIKVSDC